jgi:hypothetical protein
MADCFSNVGVQNITNYCVLCDYKVIALTGLVSAAFFQHGESNYNLVLNNAKCKEF